MLWLLVGHGNFGRNHPMFTPGNHKATPVLPWASAQDFFIFTLVRGFGMSVQEEALGQGAEIDVWCSVWPIISHFDGSTFFNSSEFYVVVFFEMWACNRVVLSSVSVQSPRSYELVCLHSSAVAGCVDAEHGRSQWLPCTWALAAKHFGIF